MDDHSFKDTKNTTIARDTEILEPQRIIVTITKSSNRIKQIDLIICMLALLGLTMAYFENEYDYAGDLTFSQIFVLRFIILVQSILVDLLLLQRHKLILTSKINQGKKQHGSGVCSYRLLIEIFINSLVAPPGVDYSYSGVMNGGTYEYTVSDLFLVLMLARIYLVLRLYKHYSRWTYSRNQVIARFQKQKNWKFALKSDLIVRPMITLFLVLVLSLVILGIAVKTVERSFNSPSASVGFDYMTNVQWMLIITMTTVGYGDFYPSTYIGWALCSITCIAGMTIISIVIVWLTAYIQFSPDETIAYMSIKATQESKILNDAALDVIKTCFKLKKNTNGVWNTYLGGLHLKNLSYQFGRLKSRNVDIENSYEEWLFGLKEKLDFSLVSIKKVISDVNKVEPRLGNLASRQNLLESKLRRALDQQKAISRLRSNI